MITENIMIAMITGGLSFAGVVITNTASNRKNAVAQAKRDQSVEDKLKALSDRVDAHNGMVDRVTNIEKTLIRLETKLEGK